MKKIDLNIKEVFSTKIASKLLLIFILNLFYLTSNAQWNSDPAINTPVCTYAGDQSNVKMVSDGAGGSILTWVDYRNSNQDVYAQHIDANGHLKWNNDGIAICTAAFDQFDPKIISDGAGGAIITWYDNRIENNWDIYAQHINSNGEVQWAANGVAICIAAGNQSMQQLTTDNAGGAIIVWSDGRNGGPNADIYAQHVNSAGSVQWNANGVAICTASYNQSSPQLISDGSGGAIITWSDFRSDYTDIYAQRITAAGVVSWSHDGVPVCMSVYHQDNPVIVSDANDGAIICWQDNRNNYVSGLDTYAQRINSSGVVQWATNGIAVCNAQYLQSFNQMVADGSGGAYITWEDRRSGNDIYAQRISSAGVPLWTIDGVPVCTSGPVQKSPQLCVNSSGNLIIVWSENYYDVAAQAVSPAGAVLWTVDGIPVCNEASIQTAPQIIAAGTDSVIIAWQDARNGSYDIYASKLVSGGTLSINAITASSALLIFPNPAIDFINFQKPDNQLVEQIVITDLCGKILMCVNNPSTQINVKALPKGIYVIRFKTDKGDYINRFIKD